jgi:hypothetical protein
MSAADAMNRLARRLGDEAALRARAHQMCAESHRQRGTILGVVEVMLSAAIGTTVVLGAMQKQGTQPIIYIGLGIVLIVQPLISRLHAYLNNPVQVDRHNRSSAAFYALNRSIGFQLADTDSASAEKLKRLVEKANREFTEVSAAGIPLTVQALRRAHTRLTEERRLEAALHHSRPELQSAQPAAAILPKLRRFAEVAFLPLIATTAIPYLIVTSSLSPHGKLAAIAVAFALALVFGSSWQLSIASVGDPKTWPGLLARVRRPMTVGVVLIMAAEMLLLVMSEVQHFSGLLERVYAFTVDRSAWIKAGLLGIYALVISWIISRQESRFRLGRGESMRPPTGGPIPVRR